MFLVISTQVSTPFKVNSWNIVTLAFAKLADIPTSAPQSFKFQFKFGAKYPFDSPEVIFIGDHIPGHKS